MIVRSITALSKLHLTQSKFTLLGLLILFAISSHTRASTLNQPGHWISWSSPLKLDRGYQLLTKIELRTYPGNSQSNQTLISFGGQKKFTATSLALGSQLTVLQSVGSREDRFSLFATQPWSDRFSNRLIFEFRHQDNFNQNSIRVRYQLKASIGKYRIWNELFFNLARQRWTGSKVFERNRLFLGRSEEVDQVGLEYGYMSQYVPLDTTSTLDHLLVLSIRI